MVTAEAISPVCMHTVAIVEDHELVRDGLIQCLANRADIQVVHADDSVQSVLALSSPPELVLLDLDLDGRQAAAEDVRAMIDRGSAVLIVSALGVPAQIRAMVRAGVAGFVPKRDSSATLFDAIDTVLAGGVWTPPDLAAILVNDTSDDKPQLTEREQRVLVLYASGLKLNSVARQLRISPHTAKEHIDRVRAKYASVGRRAATKTDLYREAVRDGLLDL